MTLIWLIDADKRAIVISVNQLNLRHQRAILLYAVALGYPAGQPHIGVNTIGMAR